MSVVPGEDVTTNHPDSDRRVPVWLPDVYQFQRTICRSLGRYLPLSGFRSSFRLWRSSPSSVFSPEPLFSLLGLIVFTRGSSRDWLRTRGTTRSFTTLRGLKFWVGSPLEPQKSNFHPGPPGSLSLFRHHLLLVWTRSDRRPWDSPSSEPVVWDAWSF